MIAEFTRKRASPRGSVYLSFDSRDASLVAAFEEYAAAGAGGDPAGPQRSGGGLERLASLVRSVVDMVAAEPELARILVDLWAARRQGEAFGVDVPAVYREYRVVIAELLADADAEGISRTGVGENHAAVPRPSTRSRSAGPLWSCRLPWISGVRSPSPCPPW
ncbi:hypothetical protein [Streptomyces sp. NPDC059258]|uniref:hypothetical protein n=1 Tax=unclassified Streptomyces TaxID=2593676 RepID=UPI00367E9DD0